MLEKEPFFELVNFKRLRELRRGRDYTLEKLSKETGIPMATVNRLELGKLKNPSLSTLIVLAEFFDVSIDELCGYKPKSERAQESEQTDTQKLFEELREIREMQEKIIGLLKSKQN